jgi:hypothetical protein
VAGREVREVELDARGRHLGREGQRGHGYDRERTNHGFNEESGRLVFSSTALLYPYWLEVM